MLWRKVSLKRLKENDSEEASQASRRRSQRQCGGEAQAKGNQRTSITSEGENEHKGWENETNELFPEKEGKRERGPLCGQGREVVVLPNVEEGRGEGRVKNQAWRAVWEATGGFKHRTDIIKVSIRSTPNNNSIKEDPFCARPFLGRAGGGVQNLVRYRDN